MNASRNHYNAAVSAAASDIHASAVSVTHAEALACAYAARYGLEVTDVLEAAKALAASGDPTDSNYQIGRPTK